MMTAAKRWEATIQFTERDLDAAVAAGALEAGRLKPLLEFLRSRATATPDVALAGPRFDLAHLLWYAGGLIVIAAMGLFSTLAFSQMGGRALIATAAVYAAVFALAGARLWRKPGLRTPAGLLIAIAVSMAPLAVYGIQDELGHWSHDAPRAYRDFYQWISGSFLYMELATIAAACLALYFFPFPFIISIVAVAIWFMSMDVVQWLAGTPNISWDLRRSVSMWFGLGMIVVAWIVDLKKRGGDFAFWLHLFGMIAFWGGLSLKDSDSEVAKALYCLLNVGLLFLAVFLERRIYAVFGALGVSIYLGYLASKAFKDSLLFPFALSLIGVAIIAVGLFYYRRQDAIAAWFARKLPSALISLRPAHAR
jgi:hypothetical protein